MVIVMDKTEDNKATPTKRTGTKNDIIIPEDKENTEKEITPEINQPDPSIVITSTPEEMPAREYK